MYFLSFLSLTHKLLLNIVHKYDFYGVLRGRNDI